MSRRVFSPDGDRYLEVRRDSDGQFRIHELDAGNHEQLMTGEAYTRKADAWRGARNAFPDFFAQSQAVNDSDHPERVYDADTYPDYIANEQAGEPW